MRRSYGKPRGRAKRWNSVIMPLGLVSRAVMQFVCDAPNRAVWFRVETEGEAAIESEIMRHAVEKYFRRERDAAVKSYRPADGAFIERDIGLNAHVQKTMPLFLTLRDKEGTPLATAMLPPEGKDDSAFRT